MVENKKQFKWLVFLQAQTEKSWFYPNLQKYNLPRKKSIAHLQGLRNFLTHQKQ